MAKDYAALARKAARLTNKQLSSEITDLARLSETDLKGLLPLKKDKQAFVELMQLVQKETDDDVAATQLAGNIKRLGKVAVRLLRFVA